MYKILIITLFIMIPVTLRAEYNNCINSYKISVILTEKAAEYSKVNNYCGAASEIEKALNLLGSAENECKNNDAELREVVKLKNQLIPMLVKFVTKCGK